MIQPQEVNLLCRLGRSISTSAAHKTEGKGKDQGQAVKCVLGAASMIGDEAHHV